MPEHGDVGRCSLLLLTLAHSSLSVVAMEVRKVVNFSHESENLIFFHCDLIEFLQLINQINDRIFNNIVTISGAYYEVKIEIITRSLSMFSIFIKFIDDYQTKKVDLGV